MEGNLNLINVSEELRVFLLSFSCIYSTTVAYLFRPLLLFKLAEHNSNEGATDRTPHMWVGSLWISFLLFFVPVDLNPLPLQSYSP